MWPDSVKLIDLTTGIMPNRAKCPFFLKMLRLVLTTFLGSFARGVDRDMSKIT